jgi:uncharacterized membrane protein
MKGTSVYTPKVTMSDKKTSPLRERLKSLTLSQIIMSAFSGIISQGTLVGVIKPFGPAFYAEAFGLLTGFLSGVLLSAGFLVVALDFILSIRTTIAVISSALFTLVASVMILYAI